MQRAPRQPSAPARPTRASARVASPRIAPALVLAISLLTTLGCGSRQRVLARLDAPAGARWQRAAVEHKDSAAYLRATDMGPSWVPAKTERTLLLYDAAGAEHRVSLDTNPQPPSPRYALAFAPDGHALGVSVDDGAAWSYVALDLPGEPLFCRHVRFQRGAGGRWEGAPTTRELVLQIVAAPRFCRGPEGSPCHAYIGDGKTPGSSEFYAAGRYVMALATADAELRLAYARAFLTPGATLFATPNLPFEYSLDEARKLALAYDDVRDVFVGGLAGDEFGNAAAVLLGAPVPGVDAALARALEAELAAPVPDTAPSVLLGASTLPADYARRLRTLTFTFALAKLAPALSAPPVEVVRALTTLATRPRLFGVTSTRGSHLMNVAEHSSKRFVVHALASHAARVPDARRALESVAAGDCKLVRVLKEEVLDGAPPLPPLPSELGELHRGATGSEYERAYTAACWARAELAARGTPK